MKAFMHLVGLGGYAQYSVDLYSAPNVYEGSAVMDVAYTYEDDAATLLVKAELQAIETFGLLTSVIFL